MKLNLQKTKLMVFNTSTTKDFEPNFEVDGTVIQVVEGAKLLGLHLTSDLKWQKHINMTTKQAYSRIWILKRQVNLGASRAILIDTYTNKSEQFWNMGSLSCIQALPFNRNLNWKESRKLA